MASGPDLQLKGILDACAEGDPASRSKFQDLFGRFIYNYPIRLFHVSENRVADFYIYVFENDRIFRRMAGFEGKVAQLKTYLSYYVLRDLYLEWQRTQEAPPLSFTRDQDTIQSTPSSVQRDYDVFLSHSSSDKRRVLQLAKALRRRGLTVWLDEWELMPGRPWHDALEEIIRTVNVAAVLVGQDGMGPWQMPEMRGCLVQFVERKMPVIPVLLPGSGNAPELPLFLRQFTWVDFRKGLTKAGLDRLEWGITGRHPKR